TCAPEKKLIIASSVRDEPFYSLYRFPYFMGNMKLIMEEFLNVAYREPEFYGYYFRENEFSAIFLDTSCSRIDSVLVSIIQGMSRQGWDLVRCFRLDDSTLIFRMKKYNFVLKGYSIQTGGYILRVKIVMDTLFHVDTSKFFDLES
ncbi:MAG: hypothetical protein GXO48_08015, partial [Chlorobi bacterium]|nr:hypothetical protein [Chlorobiota bacterium]